jgi:hypothetical protein
LLQCEKARKKQQHIMRGCHGQAQIEGSMEFILAALSPSVGKNHSG